MELGRKIMQGAESISEVLRYLQVFVYKKSGVSIWLWIPLCLSLLFCHRGLSLHQKNAPKVKGA